jgi:hypothetical protein
LSSRPNALSDSGAIQIVRRGQASVMTDEHTFECHVTDEHTCRCKLQAARSFKVQTSMCAGRYPGSFSPATMYKKRVPCGRGAPAEAAGPNNDQAGVAGVPPPSPGIPARPGAAGVAAAAVVVAGGLVAVAGVAAAAVDAVPAARVRGAGVAATAASPASSVAAFALDLADAAAAGKLSKSSNVTSKSSSCVCMCSINLACIMHAVWHSNG